MIVVADTSPLNYLILIEEIAVINSLYGSILMPSAVHGELRSPRAPAPVRQWADHLPSWAEVRKAETISFQPTHRLDVGELEAIALAQAIHANALLIDDLAGRQEARDLGLLVVGTLGILREAHENGLLDFRQAVQRLLGTNYQIAPSILEDILRTL